MKTIIKWITGVLFLLSGIGAMLQGEIAAVFLIFLSVFIIPFSYKKLVEEAANINLTSKKKFIICAVFFIAILVSSKISENEKGDTQEISESVNNERKNKIDLIK